MLKSRSGSTGPGPASQAPTIEDIRRRARHRLIGASVLVLAAVILFPIVFDTQPRPVAVDVPIVIPSRETAPPLTEPAPVAAVTPAPAPVAAEPPQPSEPVAPPTAAVEPVPAPVAAQKPAEAASSSKTAPEATDGGRAKALLEGKTVSAGATSAGDERVVVQVGAFADKARAQQVRLKLERAGLKTYTQVANTSEGPRIRVRLGPFESRAEAEAAAAKVKALDLPSAILTL